VSLRCSIHLIIVAVLHSVAHAASPDIVVNSGVPCGSAAAVTAARGGAKVVLIEPTKHIGGLSTSGGNTAESEHLLAWTIGGIPDEFYRCMGRHYRDNHTQPIRPHSEQRLDAVCSFESSVAEKVYRAMLTEAGVEVRCGASVASVKRTAP
jgi:flavin-dependent dehydrogenase